MAGGGRAGGSYMGTPNRHPMAAVAKATLYLCVPVLVSARSNSAAPLVTLEA